MMKIGEVDMNLISEEMMDAFSAWAEENEDNIFFPKFPKGKLLIILTEIQRKHI